jgi:hypothetical protein
MNTIKHYIFETATLSAETEYYPNSDRWRKIFICIRNIDICIYICKSDAILECSARDVEGAGWDLPKFLKITRT